MAGGAMSVLVALRKVVLAAQEGQLRRYGVDECKFLCILPPVEGAPTLRVMVVRAARAAQPIGAGIVDAVRLDFAHDKTREAKQVRKALAEKLIIKAGACRGAAGTQVIQVETPARIRHRVNAEQVVNIE